MGIGVGGKMLMFTCEVTLVWCMGAHTERYNLSVCVHPVSMHACSSVFGILFMHVCMHSAS